MKLVTLQAIIFLLVAYLATDTISVSALGGPSPAPLIWPPSPPYPKLAACNWRWRNKPNPYWDCPTCDYCGPEESDHSPAGQTIWRECTMDDGSKEPLTYATCAHLCFCADTGNKGWSFYCKGLGQCSDLQVEASCKLAAAKGGGFNSSETRCVCPQEAANTTWGGLVDHPSGDRDLDKLDGQCKDLSKRGLFEVPMEDVEGGK